MSENLIKIRRKYSRFAADQTLEDYSLRYTSHQVRHKSACTVSISALGSISFLALEVIGANIALHYGLNHLILGLIAAVIIIFTISYPIAKYAVKYNVDIDLLTRGAGFGYLGSSVTSLVYASFTFIFMAFESAILASLLNMIFNVPLYLGYVLSTLIVIPAILKGFKFLSRFQVFTQPLWALLQLVAVVSICLIARDGGLPCDNLFAEGSFNMLYFGASLSVLLSLVSQIGEQVDYLRFMPDQNSANKKYIKFFTVIAGPGWIIVGALKILIGALLGIIIMHEQASPVVAIDPNYMYLRAFQGSGGATTWALILTTLFVALSQVKINVTNGYAGSIAWSNFFSRLTHSHPGRVVWVFFNAGIALVLLCCGVYETTSAILSIYSILAISWCGTIAADLLINKKIGLSPKYIEFKRGCLYDINPVGFGSMIISSLTGVICYSGILGETASAFSAPVALVSVFILTPTIAYITQGKYYIARENKLPTKAQQCAICGVEYDSEDLIYCPYCGQYICSLCCTLDSCCQDVCKHNNAHDSQKKLTSFLDRFHLEVPLKFIGFMLLFSMVIAVLILIVDHSFAPNFSGFEEHLFDKAQLLMFMLMEIVAGIFTMLFLLVSESRRRARTELKKQNEILIREIDEHQKTAKLLEMEREKADAANNAKTRYLSGISHELRTPLNTILGYSQLLDKAKDIPSNHRRALETVCRSSEYLADLVEGLLDISKIEAGHLELHESTTELRKLLAQLCSYFDALAQKKGLYFNSHIASTVPDYVKTDEKRLRQILTNLLSNAVKYTAQGGVTLNVEYRSEVACIKVSDTGIGISKEDLKSIFKPFVRLDNAKKQASGTGLGLTITKLLATIMGGDLELNSVLGQGSTFTLKIKLNRCEVLQDNLNPFENVIGYTCKTKDYLTILTVDDNPQHRAIIRAFLEPLGFNVVEADCALKALEQNRRHTPDLFLLDISMPGEDGWSLLRKLRENGVHTPIVMVSAEASEGNVPDRIRRMHNGYLIKPVKREKLLEIISKVLPVDYFHDKQEVINSTTNSAVIDLKKSEVQENALQNKEISTNKEPEVKKALLDDEDLAQYLSFVDLGYIKGIRELNKKLATQGKLSSTEVEKLDALASQLNFTELLELVRTLKHG